MKYRYRNEDELKEISNNNIKLPINWSRGKAQYYFEIFAGGTPSTTREDYWNGDIPWINSGKVQNCLIYGESKFITKKGLEESSTKLIPKDTTVLAMTGATCGNVGYLTFDSTANQSVMAFCNSKKCDSKYLYYYLMCQNDQIEYYKTGGAQGGINVDNGKKLYINIPSKIEQEKIAKFLDEKTSQFDSIIAKKEKLIEKLEEAKKSLISEVVTGKVKVVKTEAGYKLEERKKEEMKDSGVEWIGTIPKEWEVKKIKYISDIISKGTTPSTIGKDFVNSSEIRFIKAENISNGNILIKPEFFIDEETNIILKRSQLKENDILFVIAGATIGKNAIVQKEICPANTNQAISFIRLKKNINVKFIFFVLNSPRLQESMWLKVVQSAQPNLSMESLGNLFVPYSNSYDINIITEYIENKVNRLDNIKIFINNQIKKLKEAKQSLISEAVTGKIEILD